MSQSQLSLPVHHGLPLSAMMMAIVVPICWGGNFTASKMAMEHFPPFLTVFLRFAAVAALLAPLVIPAYLKGARVSLRDMFVISICYITLHFTLIFVAMKNGLTISSAVIGVQLGAPFSCVLAAMFHNDRLGAWRSFGMAVAFVGVIVIAGTPDVAAHWGSFLLVVVGAFAWAAANIYMKRLGNLGVAPFLFWPAVLSLPQIGLLSLLFEQGQWQLIETAPITAWGGILYSTVFSTFVGYGLWYHLIKRYPLSQVTPFSLLVPVVGIGTAMVVYGETLTLLLIIGGLLTILGVAIITVRRPRWAILGDK